MAVKPTTLGERYTGSAVVESSIPLEFINARNRLISKDQPISICSCNNFIDNPIFQCFLGGHIVIAIHVFLHFIFRLSGSF